jgi:predicted DCC family thiol-disulfide oxidoreductase YuxK
VIKACNQSTSRSSWAILKSKGIVGRFNGTVRDVTDNDDGSNYVQAETTVAKLMRQYDEKRLFATLGRMMPGDVGSGGRRTLREERARAANRYGPRAPKVRQQQRFMAAA